MSTDIENRTSYGKIKIGEAEGGTGKFRNRG